MRRLTALLVLLILALAAVSPLDAQSSPYNTWTLGPNGFFTQTQDAYTPLAQIDLPVSSPEDMFYGPDGYLYVADTGNGRILRLDSDFQIVAELGNDLLRSPTGVFVNEDGTIFIADAGANEIVILDRDGNLVNSFGRPTEPLFGARREFRPRKIAVDQRGNLYIVSEGSVDGLVMMNTAGQFIGYFGANTADMSLKMILQRLFLSDEQLAQFIRNEAASPSNVTIDNQSLVYTVTAGSDTGGIGKFTVSGRNVMDTPWFRSSTFRDIHASEDGLLAVVDADGTIFEYDLNGAVLFVFGGPDRGDQRLGLLSNPVAIERIGGQLAVLDKGKNAIVTYGVTDFARTVHDGVRLYMDGFYSEARPDFNEVLTYNGQMLMAYQALADASFSENDYAGALVDYRLAEDRAGFSESFWELRNAVLQRHLGNALIVMAGAWVGYAVVKRVGRRHDWLRGPRGWWQRARRVRLVDDFVFMFRFIKKPADSFYYIKTNERGSLPFALLLYAWIIALRILTLYITGFVFNPFSAAWQISVETELVYTLIPLVIWNIANYLIASISDGEGSLRHVVIGTAYSLFPYALFTLPIALLSNVLTRNEAFVYTFSTQMVLVWCGIMLVIMVKEIHNFSFGETVRCILITLFTMAIFLLAAYILYVLFNQLFEFIEAIFREANLRG
ncbi:MAG: YIP1 family protein [Anaerolineae bacterium]|nr:YIP1 family protein [Anaerolineae bacterium]